MENFAGKTVLVKDINPGFADSVATSVNIGQYDSRSIPPDTAVAPNGTMYFAANDGQHGVELWETDATPTGTKLVKDIQPGIFGSFPMHLAIAGNTLLFSADDGVHGAELWQLPLS